jgi:choline dehydrogenase-like flavoprotein
MLYGEGVRQTGSTPPGLESPNILRNHQNFRMTLSHSRFLQESFALSERIYDYVIVGAGSAGCVLAYRLSADPRNAVLLIEAGGEDRDPLIDMPMGIGRTLADPKLCWYYSTEPDPRNDGKGYAWLRGKVLGGSSSINGMLYFHGQPEDYDGWAALGCTGWSWPEMARCFREMEDHQLGPGAWRGTGGPLHVSVDRQRTPLTEAVIAAGERLGLPRKADLNEPDQHGIGYSPATIRRGRRFSAVDAFITPARGRRNLDIVTGITVDRLRIERGRATGVITMGDAPDFTARREVILSAGALESPQLLQRSGIGDGAHLHALGIPVIVDRPAVGRNLREHKSISMNVALARPYSHNTRLRGLALAASALRYGLGLGGPLSSTYEVSAFLKTQADLAQPDAELMMWAVTTDPNAAGIVAETHPAMLLLGYPLRTESSGSVTIRSATPGLPPRIEANFMATEHDRRVTIGLFRFMRRLLDQPELAPLVLRETYPGGTVETDDEIVDYCVRSPTCFHAVGSCRMGVDADAIVDPALRVRGVGGARVVDCSVMPTQVSGNTNGPVMATAWRAADLILGESIS